MKHGPINHGLASAFLSYRVTLNVRKMQDYLLWVKRSRISAAIISNIPFIFVINKNILNRKAPAVKYDHTASSGGL